MRILVISNIEWDDRNAFGNTVSNFFGNWKEAEFASIYGRTSLPSNKVCSIYYRITINDIVKHLINPWKIGDVPSVGLSPHSQQTNEKSTISKIQHSKFYGIISYIADSLYHSKIWINKRYKQFVNNFNPNIVFLFGKGDSFLLSNAQYVKRYHRAKIVTFIGDDVRSDYLHRGILNRRRLNNLNKLLKISDKVYGISEELSKEYSNVYGIEVDTLYKGCTFMSITEKTFNPCEILYAGNLYYGRTEVLARLATAIARINQTTLNKFHLNIYSNSVISNQEKKLLNIPGSSTLYPPVSYQEVMNLMNKSNIVLHVESFLPNQIEKVRLSFSTKIIDCMQSGSVLMVIGPEGISSVEYVKRIQGAIVITDLNDIESTLISVLDSADSLNARAQSIRAYSIDKHSIENNKVRLMIDFQKLLAAH